MKTTMILLACLLLAAGCSDNAGLARLEEKRPVKPGPGVLYPPAPVNRIPHAPPRNINMIGPSDVTGVASLNGEQVEYCTPGKHIPQNEVAGEVNPQNPLNIVAGSNDYRLINRDAMRYDGSGGYYRTVNGGRTWTAGFLPGMVLWNEKAPGKFTSTSDPTIAASIRNTFWYCNLIFNRESFDTALGISRSTNGGASWKTTVIHEIANAPVNFLLLNDKPWLAAHPENPDVAMVTWTLYRQVKPERSIVFTRTSDGGKTWTDPRMLTGINFNQGSQVVIDREGNAHVAWYASPPAGDSIAYRKIKSDGKFGPMRLLSKAEHVASPVPWAEFYTNSFPSLAIDGESLHIVWANWNGKNADIVYVRSTNGGASWTRPLTIAGSAADELLPSVGARDGRVAVGYMEHPAGSGPSFHTSAVTSTDVGATWSQPLRITTAASVVNEGNRYDFPNCTATFIGDYNDTTVDRLGRALFFWTDIRIGNSPGDPGSTADQDPYMASLPIQ